MKWYAIQTKAGAQRVRREYWTEPTPLGSNGRPLGKGYRIVSGTDPFCSAVEMELRKRGFTFHMPAEYDAVRNRHKKNLYEVRRFALLKGYIFVSDPHDWDQLLKKTPGVAGMVCNNGEPFPIDPVDIFRLRMYEANSKALAEKKAAYMTAADDRIKRGQKKVATRAARKKLYAGRDVKLIWGKKVGREATVQAWADQDHVRALLKGMEAGEVVTVPYEFLKVAS